MDIVTATKVAKMAKKIGDRVMKYVRDDNAHSYGLDEDVSVVLRGADVSPFLFEQDWAFTTADGSLTIETLGHDRVRLTAHPFAADAHLWNGPDLLPDTQYRSMLASLFHDLIWIHRAELAAAFGWDELAVLEWGNDVLYTIWVWASGNAVQRLEARLAWHVCNLAAPWYHAAKKSLKLCCLAALLVSALAAGCVSPPAWEVESAVGTNAVLRATGLAHEAARLGRTSAGDSVTSSPSGQVSPSSSSPSAASANHHNDETGFEKPSGTGVSGVADAVEFSSLDWCWGGLKAGGAQPADGCRIGSLKVTSGGLSYKWEQGGCEKLGAASREDYSQTLACLFVRIGGRWQGGKVDWVSTSRTTRDHKNIRDGYAGWRKDAIEAADAYAFVIVSKDSEKRSNVIVFAKN